MSKDDLTIEDLLHAFLDLAEEEAPREPPGRTMECPPFGRLEAHAKKQRFLTAKEMRHVNRCPDYCQKNLEECRRHFSWQSPKFNVFPEQKLAAHEQNGSNSVYDASLQTDSGQVLGKANIVITDGPFLGDGHYLVFRLVVAAPPIEPEMLPLRISLTDLEQPGRTVFTFDVPTQANEIVKLKIPEDLGATDRWKEVEDTGHLPFAFVVQPLGNSDLRSLV